MLIADMNDLRAQQEDASKNSMLETENVETKKEDATFLRIALKLVNLCSLKMANQKSMFPKGGRLARVWRCDGKNFIFFRKAREDIEIKNQKLAQMEADYGDVVPRRDYEQLKERFHSLEKDLKKLTKDQETLMKEHRLIIG